MKKSRGFERTISIISLSISLFMMYGIGRCQREMDGLIIISVLFAIGSIISAGLME